MNFTDIDSFVDEFGKPLYQFCLKLTGRRADADDLYQETFVKVVERFQDIDMNSNPKSYLLSIAVFTWKSKCRRFARRQKIAPVSIFDEDFEQADGFHLENQVIANEQAKLVTHAVNGLDDKFRIPLYLFYTAELPLADIADILDIPLGTAKSRLHKARILLKKRLEATGYEQ